MHSLNARQLPQLAQFGDVFNPADAEEPILSEGVRLCLMDWLYEIWAEKELKAVGLKPRRKCMLSGPPGVGKTTLAHHLAARLGMRMLAVRPDKLLSKWVNHSAENIGLLFESLRAEKTPVVVFLDEFDSVGRQRGGGQGGAGEERDNWVNALLQRLEQHNGYLIAATNFAEKVDRAIWRRFELQIELEMPGPEETVRILERYLAPFVLPEAELETLASGFDGASPALMRSFCEGIRRYLVVGPKAKWKMDRDSIVGRVLLAVQPHPDLTPPTLWTQGVEHHSIQRLSWPLHKPPPPGG